METNDWHGLYGESWSGIISDEAFCHPAKFARGLIRHIYQHLFDEGLLQRGDTVLDPFAGIALGALHAMQRGLYWVGVELEQKFVDLGQQNIDLWNARYGPHLPNWGSAVLLQGDSRYLVEVVGEAGGLISSPPYSEITVGNNQRSFRPNDGRPNPRFNRDLSMEEKQDIGYSTNPANLGNMPAGDPGDRHGADAVIGSPPYAGSDPSASHVQGYSRLDPESPNYRPFAERSIAEGYNNPRIYGTHPGQLAAMPPGSEPGQVADGLNAVIASPPWEQSTACEDPKYRENRITPGGPLHNDYGNSDGQLGQESGPTFWSAARIILQQCYHVLKPGAVAVWIVKRFVRDKQIVEFSQQWADLCQSCGFELLHWHRAMLVEDGGTQLGLMGEDERKVTKRYSFFRRLHAQKYPHLEIMWEDVLCTRKVT